MHLRYLVLALISHCIAIGKKCYRARSNIIRSSSIDVTNSTAQDSTPTTDAIPTVAETSSSSSTFLTQPPRLIKPVVKSTPATLVPAPTPEAIFAPVFTQSSPVFSPTIMPATMVPVATPAPIKNNLPSGFAGLNTGIGSWFRSKNTQDYTNGNSWCGYPYKDSTPGFAPDISVMTSGTDAVYGNPAWQPSIALYCGLEARITNPVTGVSILLYITDAFDHRWVKSPGSIDIMVDSYQVLSKGAQLDKNKVIEGIKWEFTGNRNPKYAAGGPGDP